MVEPFVLQAQQHELRHAVGVAFYDELAQIFSAGGTVPGGLLADISQANYGLLLPYLKWVVLYFAYARWIEEGQDISTRSGFKVKETPWSSEVDTKQQTLRAQKIRGMAADYVVDLCTFLSDNSGNYVTWNQNLPDIDNSGLTTAITFSSV